MQVVREHRDDLVSRVRVLTAVVTGVLVAIATGFWFTQLVQGDYYRELAENNRLRKLPIKAPRGLIFDRKGRLLVENVPSYNLMIDRSRAAEPRPQPRVRRRACSAGRSPSCSRSSGPATAACRCSSRCCWPRTSPSPQVARFGVEGLDYPEFEVEVQHQRLYRHREQTAHILGYLGEPTPGRDRRIERRLPAGRHGRQEGDRADLRRRAARRATASGWWSSTAAASCSRSTSSIPAVPGKNLTLAIDLDLQQEAARWLDGPEKVGAVVAMDPRNGEILALVSAPAFNPNLFARRLQQADWKALIDDPNHPLQNRAIQNTYSPGSTFKIVMETAGLTEKIFDDHTTVGCSGPRPSTAAPSAAGGRAGTARSTPTRRSSSPATSTSTPSARRWGSRRSPATPRLFGLGLADRHRHPGGEAGHVPDAAWSQKVAQAALVPRRDDLRLDRPGAGAGHPAPDGRDDRAWSPTAATRSSPT